MATATLTLTFTDTTVTLVDARDTICTELSYVGTGTNADKLAFIQARLADYLKDIYKRGKVKAAAITAGDTATTAAASVSIA